MRAKPQPGWFTQEERIRNGHSVVRILFRETNTKVPPIPSPN